MKRLPIPVIAARRVDTILESTESKINEVVQKKNVKEFVPIRTVVMNAMDKIEKASKLHGTVTGIAIRIH